MQIIEITKLFTVFVLLGARKHLNAILMVFALLSYHAASVFFTPDLETNWTVYHPADNRLTKYVRQFQYSRWFLGNSMVKLDFPCCQTPVNYERNISNFVKALCTSV